MDIFSQFFTKRYWMWFGILFVVWYPISFFLYISYVVSEQGFLYVALNAVYPILLFLFSFVYFRKSVNDWNDRLLVAFGWIICTFLLAGLLAKPVYGLSWSSVVNVSQIQANWISFLAVIVSGLLVKWKMERVMKKELRVG